MMKHRSLFVVIALAVACASGPVAAPPPAPTVVSTPVSPYSRIPAEIGAFRLTERAAVRGLPKDSIFRYSDGSATNLSVFVYDPDAAVKVDADSQKWTAREGEAFKMVQDVRKGRGQIRAYTVAFSDTTRFVVDGRKILEHSTAMAVSYPDGVVALEMQYLYLVDGKFLKVRATIPLQGWEQTKVPSFARQMAVRLASRG